MRGPPKALLTGFGGVQSPHSDGATDLNAVFSLQDEGAFIRGKQETRLSSLLETLRRSVSEMPGRIRGTITW